MKLGFKTIVLTLAVALLCVPAAFAKNGHGHGKPSWAGGGGGEAHHGRPSWAGHGNGHADKVKAKHEPKAKHERAGAEDATADDGEVNLDDLNPAWYCKTLEAMMDTTDADAVAGGAEAGEFSSFDAEFGTNENKRNSHGKCVSRRAHGEDFSGDAAAEEEQACGPAEGSGVGTDEGSASEEPATDDGSGDSAADDGSDDPAADEGAEDGSEEQADAADECESNDSSGESQDEADDQDEDSDVPGVEDDQGDDTEAAAFARALVRFIKL